MSGYSKKNVSFILVHFTNAFLLNHTDTYKLQKEVQSYIKQYASLISLTEPQSNQS